MTAKKVFPVIPLQFLFGDGCLFGELDLFRQLTVKWSLVSFYAHDITYNVASNWKANQNPLARIDGEVPLPISLGENHALLAFTTF